MGYFKRQLDKLFLSDKEWKKKYCPVLYTFLTSDPKEQHKLYLKMCEGAEKRFAQGIKDGVCSNIKVKN